MRSKASRRALVAATLLALTGELLIAGPARSAVVICRRGKKLRLRLDACRSRETQVDAAELGVAGPPGANGATNVVMRQGPAVVLPADEFRVVEASCLPGERATGGGVYNEDSVFFPRIVSSYSTPNPTKPPPTGDGQVPTGWRVWIAQDAGHNPVTVNGYVICASP